MTEKVGFIGLGDIGLPMAKRIVTRGYEVTVCGHVRREPIEEMKKSGAREVRSPKEVALASDVTITMVRDDAQSQEVILGSDGVVEGARGGSGIIMMSTLSPAFCRKVGEAGKAKGVHVLDAPVTGTRMRAETGELGIIVGGEKELVEKYRPILETMGKIIYCGDLGAGEVVKLANNMALLINLCACHEAISWGIKNGASEEVLVELMKQGTGNSWVVQNWHYVKPMMKAVPSPWGIPIKDLSLAIDIANQIEYPVPFTALASQLIRRLGRES